EPVGPLAGSTQLAFCPGRSSAMSEPGDCKERTHPDRRRGNGIKWEQCPPSDLVTLRTRRLLYLFLTGAWVATARRPTRFFLNPIRAVSAGRILAERPGIHRHTIRRRQIHVPTVHATQPRVLFAGAVAVGMRGLHQMWGTMMLRAMCRA